MSTKNSDGKWPPHYVGFNAEKNNGTVDHIGRGRKYRRLVVRQRICLGMFVFKEKVFNEI